MKTIHELLKISLNEQCLELNIDLEEITIPDVKMPDDKALKYYIGLGYTGVKCEGLAITETLKALLLDKLEENNPSESRDDACTRYFAAQFEILKRRMNNDPEYVSVQGFLTNNQIEQIINTIKTTTKKIYLSNFKEILSALKKNNWQKDLNIEFAEKFYDAIEINQLVEIAKKILENPYQYCKGWPDLTVIKENEIFFVEVKVKDKLHESQLITLPVIKKIFGGKIKVCKLVKQR